MFEENQELINEFVIESREGLAEIETDLLEIERSGATIDVNRVNKVFRAIHSIKGACGFMGLATIGELAHALESVLNLMRNQQLVPTPGRVSVMLEAADVLKALIEDIAHSDECDVHENVAKLERVASGEEIAGPAPRMIEAPAATVPNSPISESMTVSLPKCAIADLPMVIDQDALTKAWGLHRYIYVMDFDLLQDKEYASNVADWSTRLGDTGEVLSGFIDLNGVPSLDADLPTSLPCLVVLSSVLQPDIFARFWQLPELSVHLLEKDAAVGQLQRRTPTVNPVAATCPSSSIAVAAPTAVAPAMPMSASTVVAEHAPSNAIRPVEHHQAEVEMGHANGHVTTQPTPPVSVPAVVSKSADVKHVPAPATHGEPIKAESNIRVSVSILDRLMNLAGELVLSRNQLLQTIANQDERLIESVGNRIDQVTTELQETIMATRMQQVGTVFNRFTRIVRDLSSMLGKQCQLVIEGNEVELDKTIIEAIGDPLTHLIRNSVDHGVEVPAVRERLGKTPMGTVHLRAYHQDGKVNISIADDGAGIDANKLRRKAVEKGLITPEKAEAMSDTEALRLIFLPGFSTAEQVTAVSGRGVGMDVVRTNFERLGGSVEIDTVVGYGTTMIVRLPLTLAIIPSLIVSSAGQRFAVPQVNISELVRIRQSDDTKRIERLRNAEVLRLRGSLLPLVRLSDVMQSPDSEAVRSHAQGFVASNILVVETGGLRYGLIVESLHDSEEIVVKPLGRHLSELRCFAGATVLGDGQIALILDIAGLGAQCELVNDDNRQKKTAATDEQAKCETLSTLLFTNHPDEQFGIPMNSVARIERIRIEQIDSVAGQSVLQYRGGTLPLLHIEHSMAARAAHQQSRLYVVVFRAGDREVGLVAPNILDIRDVTSNLDTRTFVGPGLLGSLVIDGRTTRFIDAYDIARHAHPEWFAAVANSQESAPMTPHLKVTQAATAERPAVMEITPIEPVASHSARPKILLAEDSAFFRKKVKQFIEQIGADVVTAEDGALAWGILQRGQHQFVGVVTDIEMPNMNGFELCEKIRSSDAHRHLPVIALTSLASDEHIRRGAQVGVSEYLIKLDRDKLVLALTNLLSLVASDGARSQLVGVS